VQVACVAAAAIALLMATAAGFARASAGGSGVGSVGAPETPKLRDAICLTSCVGLRKAVVGSTVQVSGANMAAVSSISFRSRRGHKRVDAPVTTTTNTSAQAVVPPGVKNGSLLVTDAYGQQSEPGDEPLLIRPKRNLRSAGPLLLSDAQVSPNKVFYGTRSATLSYLVGSGQPSNDLRIDVVSPGGEVVQSFFPPSAAPNTTQSVAWNGSGFDGKPVADGWYSFRLSTPDGQPLARARTSDAPDLGVAVFSFIFPVRGPHDFGSSGARFGAGRSGHTHQGQDVMSACGTKLVAARGGTVQYSGYQGLAGNYIVIDQKGSGEDNMYAHLIAPSPLRTGDKVATGQWIGNVGQTGDATACHLHFEIWTAPGWYEGGQPYDPLPLLQAWDKFS
jgi:hypothetical protein